MYFDVKKIEKYMLVCFHNFIDIQFNNMNNCNDINVIKQNIIDLDGNFINKIKNIQQINEIKY